MFWFQVEGRIEAKQRLVSIRLFAEFILSLLKGFKPARPAFSSKRGTLWLGVHSREYGSPDLTGLGRDRWWRASKNIQVKEQGPIPSSHDSPSPETFCPSGNFVRGCTGAVQDSPLFPFRHGRQDSQARAL